MKMDKFKTKIEAIFVLMVLLVSTLVVPVSAAKDMGAKNNSGYWCDTYTGGICDEGAFPDGFVELTGSEKNKALAQARTDEDVKALKKEIIADGYTPLGNGEIAGTMNINGTEVLVVTFFFKPKNGNGNETAEIIYVYNLETGDTIVMRTGECVVTCVIAAGEVAIALFSAPECVGLCEVTLGAGCVVCLAGYVILSAGIMQCFCCVHPDERGYCNVFNY